MSKREGHLKSLPKQQRESSSFEKEVFDFYKANNIPVPNYPHSLEYADPVDHAKFVFEKEKYEKFNEKINFNKMKISCNSQS